MPLKVIGAGLGRTGTATTKLALEHLGFGPCYHMSEVISDPSRIGGWMDAAAGRPDWDSVFDGYTSCVDYPAASFWKPLSEFYRDAKVLLNVRSPESWFASVNETILSDRLVSALLGTPQGRFLDATIYRTMDGRMNDRDFMIGHFERHVEAVRSSIPADRLLVYEVKQGWEPLCSFLGVPVPDEAFPRVNSREETKALLSELIGAGDWASAKGMESTAQKIFEPGDCAPEG